MTPRAAILLIALAACGDNLVPLDGGVPVISGPCTATFGGNFSESSTAEKCAAVVVDGSGEATLALTIPTTTLAPSLMVNLGLGETPSPGSYSSDGIEAWSARGVQAIGNGACLYTAGTAAVPPGSFSLHLDQLDATAGSAGGSLELTMYVLPFPGTDCGAGDTEHLSLQF